MGHPVFVGILRFLLVTLLACVLMVGIAVLVSATSAWLWGGDWDSPQFLSIGILCGMAALLFVIAFHARRETHIMSFSQREQFVAQAKTVLQKMGYTLTFDRGDTLAFRPHFHAYLFGGGVDVTLTDQEARVTGPKVSLEIFRLHLRLLNVKVS